MKELNQRNTETVEQVLKELNNKLFEQQKRIDGILATFNSIMTRVESIERMVMIQKAISTGHGPSVQ